MNYGNEERIQLMLDFYYVPWVFYGENIRFQSFSKGIGFTYDIATGKFIGDYSQETLETFDKMFSDVRQLEVENKLNAVSTSIVGGNKVKLLGGYDMMVK